MKPIILGILAAFFFAFTFVLNQSMDIAGGSWIWSASLRYFFMVPFLLIIVASRNKLKVVWDDIKAYPKVWLLWSTVGFGIFYGGICFASAFGPSWLIAGTWQLTIVSGLLLAPLFYETSKNKHGIYTKIRRKIPFKSLTFSSIIVLGVFIMQIEFAASITVKDALFCLIPIILASFAYPLGNRKMMEHCDGRIGVYERVLGMTIASMPFWIILSVIGFLQDGLPNNQQIVQSGMVAVFSGICATVLFFKATDMVRNNMTSLGAVEATQSFEVLFALIGEILFLGSHLPTPLSMTGIAVVMIGMILHSVSSSKIIINKKRVA
ncbi:multidrug resistance efflux transporter family protein [Bacillus sp. B1-b2]|uniref:DMT family transporter n=1 Tax=Bacillus sp. B1-b2 TaxID=2653201 RepID=UPI0012613C2D|nr:multidrug resistance efflux transporter family protein [Bacillus sp. B1-b2]KAB7673238.1 multidrug resistance efflux transporter family protein [Bacillus sp. B1-b2]